MYTFTIQGGDSMVTYNNRVFYTKSEIIQLLELRKSEFKNYKKHIFDRIINMVINSKQKYFSLYINEDIFLKFRQNLIKEVEKQYKEAFKNINCW
jgi:hydroxymethylpyrimidine pyrophosphatase-like HAD family hydrolase